MKNIIQSPVFWGLFSLSFLIIGAALQIMVLLWVGVGVLALTVFAGIFHSIKNLKE